MNKLRKLRLKAFRGARFDLPLDFTSNCSSVAIYGENAAGKSSVTDAIEWFFKSKVDHLWGEDCKDPSLRNKFAGDNDPVEVESEFSDAELNSVISLSDTQSRAEHSNKSKKFRSFVDDVASERVFLRHRDISNFVIDTKTAKRNELEKIIGFDDIKKFREEIRTTLSALQTDAKYTNAVQQSEKCDSELLELCSETIATDDDRNRKINEILAAHGVDIEVKDKETFLSAIAKLKKLTGDEKNAEKRVRYENLLREIKAFCDVAKTISSRFEEFERKYKLLIEDTEAVSKIRLKAFLASGLKVIDGGDGPSAKCPLCLTSYDLELLKSEIDKRIAESNELDAKYRACEVAFNTILVDTRKVADHSATIGAQSKEFDELSEQLAIFSAFSAELKSECDHLEKRFAGLEPLSEVAKSILSLPKKMADAIAFQNTVRKGADKLKLSADQEKVFQSLQSILDIARLFKEREDCKRIVGEYRKQILTLDSMLREFIEVQNKALQEVLDAITEDVSSYFDDLHPSANIKDVRLLITGEQGVEFHYEFYGEAAHPPKKFLSESYLNSLGIVLFLATAKLINKNCKFLILDDIVTSFDQNHRRRLIRLLKNQFADWQLIVLTHEAFWFDMLKSELSNAGWLFREVTSEGDNGARIAETPETMREMIEEKRKSHDVSNDVRILTEASLKRICYQIQAKVAFQFNDANEKRMGGELLSAIEGAVNKHKSQDIRGADIFSKLRGSAFVTTTGSHDNPAKPSDEDINLALQDIDELNELFRCDQCGRFVDADNVVPGQNQIACKCGHKKIEWKAR